MLRKNGREIPDFCVTVWSYFEDCHFWCQRKAFPPIFFLFFSSSSSFSLNCQTTQSLLFEFAWHVTMPRPRGMRQVGALDFVSFPGADRWNDRRCTSYIRIPSRHSTTSSLNLLQSLFFSVGSQVCVCFSFHFSSSQTIKKWRTYIYFLNSSSKLSPFPRNQKKQNPVDTVCWLKHSNCRNYGHCSSSAHSPSYVIFFFSKRKIALHLCGCAQLLAAAGLFQTHTRTIDHLPMVIWHSSLADKHNWRLKKNLLLTSEKMKKKKRHEGNVRGAPFNTHKSTHCSRAMKRAKKRKKERKK